MPIIHYRNEESEYLCSNIINPNSTKMSNIINDVNCVECLKLISENDFSISEPNQNQTSLKGLIF